MLGDDPDPKVTIARFGFGEVSDTGEGAMHCAKRLRFRQEGKRRTRLVSEESTKTRGKRGNYERMQVLKTMTTTSADAMPMMR